MPDTLITVLLIEDNAGDTRLIQKMLDDAPRASFQLRVANRLATGLECVGAGEVDLVLLDLSLPDSWGMTTFIEARKQVPQMPIIVLTNLDDEELAVEAVQKGAQDYLVKGQVDSNLLSRAIRYAIERNRTEETLRQRNRELALLNRVGQTLSSVLELDQVLVIALEEVRNLLDAIGATIWLTDAETGELVCRQSSGLGSDVVRGWRLAAGEGIAGHTISCRESIIVADAGKDERHFRGIDQEIGLELYSILSVPLRAAQKVIGVLQVVDTEPNRFDEIDKSLLEFLAAPAAIAIENARLFAAVKEQREQLQVLAKRLSETEEAERKRLARELHDRVGQNLTALSLNLNMLRARLPKKAAEMVSSRLDDSLALVDQTTECIRDVMIDLRPSVLDDYGLVAALNWYGNRVASRTGIKVAVNAAEGTFKLPMVIENALFRVTQEALTNVAKHAQATQVVMTLEVSDSTVKLVIADDGTGFDLDAVYQDESRQRLGLSNMSERVETIGGKCRVMSRLNVGTQVILEVPL